MHMVKYISQREWVVLDISFYIFTKFHDDPYNIILVPLQKGLWFQIEQMDTRSFLPWFGKGSTSIQVEIEWHSSVQ